MLKNKDMQWMVQEAIKQKGVHSIVDQDEAIRALILPRLKPVGFLDTTTLLNSALSF